MKNKDELARELLKKAYVQFKDQDFVEKLNRDILIWISFASIDERGLEWSQEEDYQDYLQRIGSIINLLTKKKLDFEFAIKNNDTLKSIDLLGCKEIELLLSCDEVNSLNYPNLSEEEWEIFFDLNEEINNL